MGLSSIKKWILSITKKDIIYGLVIALLICALSISVDRCLQVNHEYKNNIEALNDTIHYYKAKNGNLVATKLAFESDIKTLKLLNEDLYNEIKNLKAKSDIITGTYFSGIIDNEIHDTTYVVQHDTIQNGFSHDFAFNNEYRILEGNVNYKNDTVGVKISKDIVNFDYTVAMDKKNNIYITSNNPYVKYNQITGFQLPQQKQKHWSLSAFGNFAYEPRYNDRYLDLGLEVDYNIKRFSIGPMIYYERNFLNKENTVYIGISTNLNILEW